MAILTSRQALGYITNTTIGNTDSTGQITEGTEYR